MKNQIPKIRGPYDRNQVHPKNDLPSLTEQSHQDGCDLKLIMDRFTKTGEIPPSRERQILYGDAPPQESDLLHNLSIIRRAETAFSEMPENVTKTFKNVADFLDALDNPDRVTELQLAGLIMTEEEHSDTLLTSEAKPSQSVESE